MCRHCMPFASYVSNKTCRTCFIQISEWLIDTKHFYQFFISWRPKMLHFILGGMLSCELCMMTCNNEEQLEMHFQVWRFLDIKCVFLNDSFFRVRGINQSFWEFKQVRFNFNVPFVISAPPVRVASLNILRLLEWVVFVF